MLAGRRAQEVVARQKRTRESRRRIVTVWGLGWGSEIFLETSQREGQARETRNTGAVQLLNILSLTVKRYRRRLLFQSVDVGGERRTNWQDRQAGSYNCNNGHRRQPPIHK